MAQQYVMATTDENFENDVLKSNKPVLVDFWAKWCGPCKMIAPVLEEVAQQYADRVKVFKVDVDDNETTPVKYGVQAIPNLILFINGAVAGSKVGGNITKTELIRFLDAHIGEG